MEGCDAAVPAASAEVLPGVLSPEEAPEADEAGEAALSGSRIFIIVDVSCELTMTEPPGTYWIESSISQFQRRSLSVDSGRLVVLR